VCQHRIDQILFHILLLQVGHGEETVVRVVRRFHAKHRLPTKKRMAKTPRQSLLDDALGHPHLLQNF
jgi:hypothetical protein